MKAFNTMTNEEIKAYLNECITWTMNAKMEGMASLSTSPLCNKYCEMRHANKTTICGHCFSEQMNARFKNLREKLIRNTEFLTTYELKPEQIPFINRTIFRLESFGDLNNTLQVKNYFTIANANPGTTFTLWTKNPWLIDEAMKTYGIDKPDNFIIILSSILMNTPNESITYGFIDKVFTVYDKEHAESVNINCGARKCVECRRCYTKTDSIEYVNELLK